MMSAMLPDISLEDLARELAELPESWHGAGTVQPQVLSTLVRLARAAEIRRSVETGAGRTTVLLSRLSPDHTVFAVDAGGSISAARSHPRFRAETVRFVEGVTQRTLPRHQFEGPLDLALIDGPHGYPFPDLEYFYLYPLLNPGALLVVDDIHIPTVRHMFDFLREDAMYRLEEIAGETAFFRRTDAPTFSPECDGWWEQRYNSSRFPLPTPSLASPEPAAGGASPAPPETPPGPLSRLLRRLGL